MDQTVVDNRGAVDRKRGGGQRTAVAEAAAFSVKHGGGRFSAVSQTVTGFNRETALCGLRPVKLRVLYVHADAVALRLRGGCGCQAAAFYRHRAARAGFTGKRGVLRVQREVTATVRDRTG